MKHKNVEISESLQQARKERDALEGDLRAAKAETSRFREMLESRAAMDDDIKVMSSCVLSRARSYVRTKNTFLSRPLSYLSFSPGSIHHSSHFFLHKNSITLLR